MRADVQQPADLVEFRQRFPILAEKVYLNSCSQGALSTDVEAAYREYLADWHQYGSPWDLWVGKLEEARTAFASLIRADSVEIAVTTSVSAAVSAVASALDFGGSRNRVVVSESDFPTVGQIWHAQERRGAVVRRLPAAGQRVAIDSFEDAIDDRTLLVSITHVCYRNGVMIDVPSIVKIAHERGALVLLDSFQALGTMTVDAKALGVDFLVGGALKYLLGPAGLAYLYVRNALIDSLLPTCMGWFSQEDIFAMDGTANRPSSTARRFESGTPPVPNLYAGLAGIELLCSTGMASIHERISALGQLLIDTALERGYALATPAGAKQHGAMVALRSTDPARLVSLLASEGIIVSSRDGNIRVSPHGYNDMADIDRLLCALDRYNAYLVQAD